MHGPDADADSERNVFALRRSDGYADADSERHVFALECSDRYADSGGNVFALECPDGYSDTSDVREPGPGRFLPGWRVQQRRNSI